MSKTKVGIINVTGYAGVELARLLYQHPGVELTSVTGRSAAGQKLGTVFPHLTSLELTIEAEPGLLSDFQNMWQRTIPKGIAYDHDRAWGDGNGYSHVRASLLGASLVVPFNDQQLTLGTWQQIVLVDFDNRPRSRQVILQIIGD